MNENDIARMRDATRMASAKESHTYHEGRREAFEEMQAHLRSELHEHHHTEGYAALNMILLKTQEWIEKENDTLESILEEIRHPFQEEKE